MQPLINIFNFIPKKFKIKTFLFFFLIFLSSLLDVIGIGLFFPILNYLIKMKSGIDLIDNYLNQFNMNINQIIIAITLFTALIFILKNLLIIYTSLYQSKFIGGLTQNLSGRLFKHYLSLPLKFHVSTNSSKMLRNTRDEVFIFVSHIFNNILYLAIDLTLIFVFLIFLILFGNFYSSIIILFFLAVAKIYYQSLKKIINVYGNRRSEIAEKVFKYLKEGFSSFKEIKIYNKKNFFVKRYEIEWKKNVSMSVIINLIEVLPKVIFEIIAVFLFLLLINFFIKTQQDFSEFIPILSIYILSIYRILPGIIRFLRNFQKIKHYMPAFYNISNAHNKKIDPLDTLEITHNQILKFKFKKIELKNIFFKYEKRKILFQNLNLSILKKSKTLINGKSGCGKSTLLDIICGLSNPTSGEVLINGKIATLLDKKLLLHNISYVSQSSIFIDNSLFLNIAFAEEKNADLKKILNLLKLVELNEFFDKLKTGIDVPVGEAASQLSGGEKQRVAIARALYFNPKILILDEATNAIDFYTESKILENIRKKIKDITIIKVSHATHDYGNLFLKYKLKNKKLTKANF